MTRNQRILSMRGKKSYTEIADELGISRSVVAGVCWRADWPYGERIGSPKGHNNKCGLGHHGPKQLERA